MSEKGNLYFDVKKLILSHHKKIKKTEIKIEEESKAFQERSDEILKKIHENKFNDKLQ